MEYLHLSGKELDQWAEQRGIKRYQGFIFPDSDEKFKEEITKSLPKTEANLEYGFITFTFVEGGSEVRGRLILVDEEGDFLFEAHPDWVDRIKHLCTLIDVKCFREKEAFHKRFPKLSNSKFFWIMRENIKCLDSYMGDGYSDKLLKIDSIDFSFD